MSASNRWSTGLFDCCSDMETFCIPDAVLLGQQNKIIAGSGARPLKRAPLPLLPKKKKSKCFFVPCPTLTSFAASLLHTRSRQRRRRSLPTNSTDFCTCPCCCYGCLLMHPFTMPFAATFAACTCIGPNRQELKKKLGITEDDCVGECCCSCMCGPLVLCQMGRELKARGVYTMVRARAETE